MLPTLLKIKPSVTSCISGNKIQTIFIGFREGFVSEETVRFVHRKTGDRMLVDRGSDGYPIAAQLISADGMPIRNAGDAEPLDVDEAIHTLFTFTTEMLRFREQNLLKRGNELIKDAVDHLSRVPTQKLEPQTIPA